MVEATRTITNLKANLNPKDLFQLKKKNVKSKIMHIKAYKHILNLLKNIYFEDISVNISNRKREKMLLEKGSSGRG